MLKSILSETVLLPCGQVLPSRLLKSAMSEGLGTPDHGPRTQLIDLYKTWGSGGPCLLVTGNIMIDRHHLGEPGNVVVEDQSHLSALRSWAHAAQEHGCILWGQLNHPGKQSPSFLTKEPVSASAIGLGISGFHTPRELSTNEVAEIVQKFVNSAAILKNAGFQGVQIHGAHGYLVAQFLSPRHNQRQDQYGGTLANRMRFVTEIYQGIRAEVGVTFAVGIKLNSSDFQEGGFSEDESLEVIRALAALGIDLIEISGGNYEAPSMMGASSKDSRQGYFVEFAARARVAVNGAVPIAVTGGFRTVEVMADTVASMKSDMIGLARPFVLHPQLVKKALSGDQVEFDVPYRLTTGLRALDKVIMIGLTWYTRQIHILAKGKPVDKDLHPVIAAFGLLLASGIQNFRRTRQ